jgi:hypothetical protein
MKKRLLMEKLRVLVVCLGLEVGVLAGVPVRPEEIQELLHQMNQPKIAHVLPSASGDRDPADE